MLYSISPLTNKQYIVPEIVNDQLRINEFISNKKDKIVVVQGLGFVGSAMALVVANSSKNYKVIGVDLNLPKHFWKIASFNEGIAPIESSDPLISQYMQNAKEKNLLIATSDPYAYACADVIIVDINLDVNKERDGNGYNIKSYEVKLGAFENAIRLIGKHCKNDCLVLVETTVPPGCCKNIVYPLLKEELSKRNLPFHVKVGHSYERVTPGENYLASIENFYRVYSGIDLESENAVEVFLKTVIKTDQYPLTKLKSTNASEMAKVMENCYRAMNIAFIQDWIDFASRSEVDLNEVISAIKMRPTHNNIMRPGLGVGGYCLTKDPLIASWANQHFFSGEEMSWCKKSVEVNDHMPLQSVKFIKNIYPHELDGKRILIMGVSYLGNIADTRLTPVEKLFTELEILNTKIDLHDPFVTFWEEKNIPINFKDFNEINFSIYDIIIFSANHRIYGEDFFLRKMSNIKSYVFDLNFCLPKIFVEKQKNCYVLGNFFNK